MKLLGETVEVNAKIETLKGISGHADMNGLLAWMEGFRTPVKHVFVVHGEDTVTDVFANTIEERFGYPAMAPYSGGCVDLLTGEILSAGVREPKKAAEKPSKARSRMPSNVWWQRRNTFSRWFIKTKDLPIKNWQNSRHRFRIWLISGTDRTVKG